jgi:hypothetical protein
MADELKQQVSFVWTSPSGESSVRFQPNLKQIDVAGSVHMDETQTVGTSAETLDVNTDIATLGWAIFHNVEDPDTATNYVDIGPDSSGLVGFARLYAGEWCITRLKPGITIKGQASAATVNVRKLVLPN